MTEDSLDVDPRSDPDRTEQWLLDASSQLGPSSQEVDDLTGRVIAVARRLAQSRRLLVTDRAGIEVSSVVVNQALLTEVRRSIGRSVLDINLGSDERGVNWMRVAMLGRYGDDFDALSVGVRAAALRAVASTIGPQTAAALTDAIDVAWIDLES